MNFVTVWLIVFVACIVIEIITMGLTTIWFAGGALIAAVSAGLGAPLWLQINKDRVKTNVESLVGKQAIVISEIDNLQGIGQVTVGGREWSARTTVDGIKLPVGSVVMIRAISGVKLMVEEKPV